MAIYLLNTSVIIDALNRKRGRETLACSAMTVMEIYAGLPPHESVTTQAFLDGLEHYTVKQGPNAIRTGCYRRGSGADSQTCTYNGQPQGFSNSPISDVLSALSF